MLLNHRLLVCLIYFAFSLSQITFVAHAQEVRTEEPITTDQPAPIPTEDNLLTQTNSTIVGIPDNAYVGGFGPGMACTNIVTNGLPVNAVVVNTRVDMRLDHTWVGDLTIKLRSPTATIITILNRPVSTAPDDGADAPVGDSSNWAAATSIGFGDGLGPEAETMGTAIADAQNICINDGVCFHDPSPDTATVPPAAFSAFRNSAARGTWTLCVGDSNLLDTGNLRSWTLTLTFAIPFTASPNISIPDDGYAGGFGGVGQSCSTIAVPAGGPLVQGVFLSVDIAHTWVGDLTMKLRSPAGTIFTVLNRPGSTAADDGGGAVGANANWNGPLLFGDGFGPEAETMGAGLTTDLTVCNANGVCSHDPSPDTAGGPASFGAGFNGQVATGNWTLCMGDSALGDVGTLRSWRLNLFDHLAPTAAPVSVSGRVFTPLGSTINKARVTMTNQNGEVVRAVTNPFGYYSFGGVLIGDIYLVTVEAKGYTFETRTISVVDEIRDLDFVGQPSFIFKQQE